MPTALTTSAVAAHDGALSTRQRARFAAQWFAQVAERPEISALGAHPQRVLRHLIGAPLRRDIARVNFQRLSLADATIATACVDGDHAAWARLESLAPLLERSLLGLYDAQHPHVAARRFLDRVRAATRDDRDTDVNLRRYSAECPLRVWLVDRLLGGAAVAFPTLPSRASANRLRIAFQLIETKRERARAMLAAMDAPPAVERLIADPN